MKRGFDQMVRCFLVLTAVLTALACQARAHRLGCDELLLATKAFTAAGYRRVEIPRLPEVLTEGAPVFDVKFSGDERTVAILGETREQGMQITIVDARAEKVVKALVLRSFAPAKPGSRLEDSSSWLQFSEDAKMVYVFTSREMMRRRWSFSRDSQVPLQVLAYEVATGKCAWSRDLYFDLEQASLTAAQLVSPKLLALGFSQNRHGGAYDGYWSAGSMRLVNLETLETTLFDDEPFVATGSVLTEPKDFVLSANGKRLVVMSLDRANHPRFSLWNAATGRFKKYLESLPGNLEQAWSNPLIAFGDDGRKIFAKGHDGGGGVYEAEWGRWRGKRKSFRHEPADFELYDPHGYYRRSDYRSRFGGVVVIITGDPREPIQVWKKNGK